MKLLIGIVLLVSISCIFACKCRSSTQKEIWERSNVVAKMKIKSKTENGHNLEYTADYLVTYKHDNLVNIASPVKLTTASHSAACGVTQLQVGSEYLITASQDGNTLKLSSCSGMPAKNEDGYGSPLGALDWSKVDSALENKLKSGKF